MKQISLASSGFELVTKKTRKREFLCGMNRVVPWAVLAALIEPYAPSYERSSVVLILARSGSKHHSFVGITYEMKHET